MKVTVKFLLNPSCVYVWTTGGELYESVGIEAPILLSYTHIT